MCRWLTITAFLAMLVGNDRLYGRGISGLPLRPCHRYTYGQRATGQALAYADGAWWGDLLNSLKREKRPR